MNHGTDSDCGFDEAATRPIAVMVLVGSESQFCTVINTSDGGEAGDQKHGRGGAMEVHQSGRNQQFVETLSEKLRKKCWESTKWKSAREERAEEEVSGVEDGAEGSKQINFARRVKTAGRESFRGSRNTIYSETKACKRARRKKRRRRSSKGRTSSQI